MLDRALEQIPGEYVEQIEILMRTDSAGATHDPLALAAYAGDGAA